MRTKALLTTGRAVAALLAVGGIAFTYLTASSTSASAQTLGGTATIASPNGDNPPLSTGGSEAVFTVTLPAQAACSEDTENHQYHVFSYLLKEGVAVTSDNFSSGLPSEGLGLVDASGDYYGPANTAPGTGEIINIPNDFEWAGLLKVGETAADLDGGSTEIWNTGLACANPSGTVTDYWNSQLAFVKSSSDPNGFIWWALPGEPPTAPAPPTSPAVTFAKTTATVSWTAPVLTGGSAITGYDVYDSTTNPPSTSGTPNAKGKKTAKDAKVKKLKAGDTYYFVVTAVNAQGQSAASAVVSGTVP
ncbi:MAG TPA: fibronectin type III domain-containing protein [Acidimicrobiales bacterium]|nr:fibronectin type III domain-containing protein [Acidimicrobiales bacterium]